MLGSRLRNASLLDDLDGRLFDRFVRLRGAGHLIEESVVYGLDRHGSVGGDDSDDAGELLLHRGRPGDVLEELHLRNGRLRRLICGDLGLERVDPSDVVPVGGPDEDGLPVVEQCVVGHLGDEDLSTVLYVECLEAMVVQLTDALGIDGRLPAVPLQRRRPLHALRLVREFLAELADLLLDRSSRIRSVYRNTTSEALARASAVLSDSTHSAIPSVLSLGCFSIYTRLDGCARAHPRTNLT